MSSLVERLGPTAIISFRTNPAGVPATLVTSPGASSAQSALTYQLSGPVPVLPARAETVHCLSGAGNWSTTVREVRPDVLLLDPPPWLVRSQQRKAVRVEVSVPVTLDKGRGPVAARLVDLTAGGGGAVLEAATAPLVGAQVSVRLPTGASLVATVRSRRGHDHRLLRVVGLEWTDPDASSAHWIEREVARATRAAGRPRAQARENGG
ncbi:PilZ domain-containing protein [Angustibacter luteus]|uniref:PilZ domain-containing protein n=1 Tax=Angustibacter luteus TaxID=658456 RepID=A0ABW1JIE8_9ACTN